MVDCGMVSYSSRAGGGGTGPSQKVAISSRDSGLRYLRSISAVSLGSFLTKPFGIGLSSLSSNMVTQRPRSRRLGAARLYR